MVKQPHHALRLLISSVQITIVIQREEKRNTKPNEGCGTSKGDANSLKPPNKTSAGAK